LSVAEAAAAAFARRFGHPPLLVVRAPGRVNLIGEHTDYNGGFVLPVAIDRWVSIALEPDPAGTVSLTSFDFDETARFTVAEPGPRGSGWTEYVKGMAWALAEAGHALAGWRGVVSGDVPRGAGLSSSAAFEMAVARAFSAVSGFAWDPVAMALVAQRAENQWVGVSCGIMDPLISGCGRAGHALLLDCRSLERIALPLPAGCAVVVLDTATRRSLSESGFNERRRQCEAAAAACGVGVLRELEPEHLPARLAGLSDVARRRVRHVVSENARTLAAARALGRGDVDAFGRLMNESHASLRDDFEVSTAALDAMAAAARQTPGCLGARMTGGGFGGCVVALVAMSAVAEFQVIVLRRYEAETGREGRAQLCRPTDGAQILEGTWP
jgi:galactokinase